MVLIKLVNSLLLFLNGLGIYGNVAPILAYKVLTVGLSAAVAFTTKSLSKFVCKMDKCCPQFSSTALCFV